ncbi:MAG TPA: hypothetical protein VHK67_07370 [Rhabdochlamydiaceae bacterium]|jgi:hypothetical protein|nr:hypothetical protein [Rhabdochlamydiaceae bacterium]
MATSSFNLRGIPEEVMALLKREAKRLHTSVNVLILKMIERGLGFSYKKNTYHDLDHLAGTWSAADAKNFEESIKPLEKIDKELWS